MCRFDEHLSDGVEIVFADALKDDLTTALEQAKQEWTDTEPSQDVYTSLLAEARETAGEFEDDLVSFRNALRAHVGSSHPDYRRLRTPQARVVDADDDEAAVEAGPQDGGTSDSSPDLEPVDLGDDEEAAE